MKVFYDVDTQNDFIKVDGALAIKDAEALTSNLRELTQYALKSKIMILGSVDRHFGNEKNKEKETELSKWNGPFPNHCMDGTHGQKKIVETTAENVLFIRSDSVEIIKFDKSVPQQLIFEKQSCDIFWKDINLGGNNNIDKVLQKLNVDEVIVYGVATDYCVKAAVFGFRKRMIKVTVVKDAIKAVNIADGEKAITEMKETGAKFIQTKDIEK